MRDARFKMMLAGAQDIPDEDVMLGIAAPDETVVDAPTPAWQRAKKLAAERAARTQNRAHRGRRR